MAFYKNPIIEEPATCMVCSAPVMVDEFICSGTCDDLWGMRERTAPAMDMENNCE